MLLLLHDEMLHIVNSLPRLLRWPQNYHNGSSEALHHIDEIIWEGQESQANTNNQQHVPDRPPEMTPVKLQPPLGGEGTLTQVICKRIKKQAHFDSTHCHTATAVAEASLRCCIVKNKHSEHIGHISIVKHKLLKNCCISEAVITL